MIVTPNKGNTILLAIKHRYRGYKTTTWTYRGPQFPLKLPQDLHDLTATSQQPLVLTHNITYAKSIKQAKMMFLTTTFFLLTCVYDSSAVDIMPKLKRNILNFGGGVNSKYEGMLSHSFNRFSVVAKYELPKVSYLKLTTIEFDLTCSHLNGDRQYMTKLWKHCLRIAPYISFYQRQTTYYNLTTHRILTKDNRLILPIIPTTKRNK